MTTDNDVADWEEMELVGRTVILTYMQEEDCAGRPGAHEQWLRVETCDGGGGAYAVLSTERWAVSSREDAINMLNRVFDDLGIE